LRAIELLIHVLIEAFTSLLLVFIHKPLKNFGNHYIDWALSWETAAIGFGGAQINWANSFSGDSISFELYQNDRFLEQF